MAWASWERRWDRGQTSVLTAKLSLFQVTSTPPTPSAPSPAPAHPRHTHTHTHTHTRQHPDKMIGLRGEGLRCSKSCGSFWFEPDSALQHFPSGGAAFPYPPPPSPPWGTPAHPSDVPVTQDHGHGAGYDAQSAEAPVQLGLKLLNPGESGRGSTRPSSRLRPQPSP